MNTKGFKQMLIGEKMPDKDDPKYKAVSYTHLTLPTKFLECRSRWSPYH